MEKHGSGEVSASTRKKYKPQYAILTKMEKFLHKTLIPVTLGALPLVLAASAALGYAAYRHAAIQEETGAKRYADLKAELHSEVVVLGDKIAALESHSGILEDNLTAAKNVNTVLAENLKEQQAKASTLESSVTKISGTVGTLEKLSKTDPELLQKYSKVFFLSENYVPERLMDIPKSYLYSEQRREQMEQRVWPFLKGLLDAAAKDSTTIYIKSAYRSFPEQKDLKGAYSVTYGAGTANQFSAEQGYSEHQLGTTVDLITTGLGGQLSQSFDGTQAYAWLLANAHKYGFTLSYPPGNSFYTYEPWHWRFVGAALATRLKNEGVHFYDLDQREIDKYLVNILD